MENWEITFRYLFKIKDDLKDANFHLWKEDDVPYIAGFTKIKHRMYSNMVDGADVCINLSHPNNLSDETLFRVIEHEYLHLAIDEILYKMYVVDENEYKILRESESGVNLLMGDLD